MPSPDDHPLCQPFSVPFALLEAIDAAEELRASGRPPWRAVNSIPGKCTVLDADNRPVLYFCEPHIASQIVAAVNGAHFDCHG